jgi:hypothetical protein
MAIRAEVGGRLARPGVLARVRARVLAMVSAIPEGRVTTYGGIGRRVHVGARQVAFILATLTAGSPRRPRPGLPTGRVFVAPVAFPSSAPVRRPARLPPSPVDNVGSFAEFFDQMTHRQFRGRESVADAVVWANSLAGQTNVKVPKKSGSDGAVLPNTSAACTTTVPPASSSTPPPWSAAVLPVIFVATMLPLEPPSPIAPPPPAVLPVNDPPRM